jgi:integrase
MAGTVATRPRVNRQRETGITWFADYYDQHGVRHRKTFDTKRAAERWPTDMRTEVKAGIHTPDACSTTLKEAAERWLRQCEVGNLEAGPLRTYGQYVRLFNERDPRPAEMGVDIPRREEMQAILQAAARRWRPRLLVLTFTGLRASELRALEWSHLDLERKVLSVRQRADWWGGRGPPKSKNGYRDVPLAPMVSHALKEWQLAALRATDCRIPSFPLPTGTCCGITACAGASTKFNARSASLRSSTASRNRNTACMPCAIPSRCGESSRALARRGCRHCWATA